MSWKPLRQAPRLPPASHAAIAPAALTLGGLLAALLRRLLGRLGLGLLNSLLLHRDRGEGLKRQAWSAARVSARQARHGLLAASGDARWCAAGSRQAASRPAASRHRSCRQRPQAECARRRVWHPNAACLQLADHRRHLQVGPRGLEEVADVGLGGGGQSWGAQVGTQRRGAELGGRSRNARSLAAARRARGGGTGTT